MRTLSTRLLALALFPHPQTAQMAWVFWVIHYSNPLLQIFFFFFFFSLGLHLQHMEVPRLRVKSELQMPACTTAAATPDLSFISNLRHSLQQCWILSILTGASYWTLLLRILVGFSTCWAMMGTPPLQIFKPFSLINFIYNSKELISPDPTSPESGPWLSPHEQRAYHE